MELYTMRYVLAVAEHENFSLAAQACHVGQPALSQQIAKLERELGVALFHRNSRGAALTQAGEEFVRRAREILQLAPQTLIRAIDGIPRVHKIFDQRHIHTFDIPPIEDRRNVTNERNHIMDPQLRGQLLSELLRPFIEIGFVLIVITQSVNGRCRQRRHHR